METLDNMLIKIDLLSVECLDKIHTCLDLLINNGYINKQSTLKETYEKYLNIYELERNNIEMWKMVWNHEIQSLFQMEKQSGIQGIALIHPKSVNELSVLNSVIRLMAPDKDSDQPLVQWAKYRKDINLWYNEMRLFGLTEEEIQWLANHSAVTNGICESQEGLMSLVQEERLGGNSLSFADKCRKALAKKIGGLFDECEHEFYKNIEEKKCSNKLAHYVWDILLRVQRGYSFNRSHCLAYSLVALQEMNLAFKFPIIFWNCACLITDSGGMEDELNKTDASEEYEDDDEEEDILFEENNDEVVNKKKNKSNNYDKIATAIGKMRREGINITPPDINKSSYTFIPDVENNKILFGLRGILNVGDEIILSTINNRPYVSPRDYINKVKPNKQAMISLIKAGAFDSMMDRKICMGWYIWETCDKKSRITLQNIPGLIKYKLLPEDTEELVNTRRIYEFNRFLKAICKYDSRYFKLNDRAITFLTEMDYSDLIESNADEFFISIKKWDKIYQKWMDVFRVWINEDKDSILDKLNQAIFLGDWQKYAKKGNISSWEMESLCFYYHQHELAEIDSARYGFVDFFNLSENPIVEKTFTKNGRDINIFKLHRICGTCIAKNKNKATISLLTTTGVVEVKFRKEYFSLFDKQISVKNPDGSKTVMEKSWFNRGSMIVVTGIRSGDNFIAKKYNSTPGHTLYKIEEVINNKELRLVTERYQGGIEEEIND